MNEQSAPPRWVEAPEDAPDAFLQASAAYADLGPSPEARARGLDALQLRLSQPTAARAARRLLTWGGLVVLAVGTYAAVRYWPSVQATRSTPASTQARERAVDPQRAKRPEPMPVAAPSRALAPDLQAVPAVPPAGGTRPAADRGSESRTKRQPSKASAGLSSAAAASPAAESPLVAGELQTELQLLMRARRVVRDTPSRALALTTEHAARYPDGAFAEEREVIAVQALLRLGQREQAATRARVFSSRYPRSAHRQRIADVLAAP